MRIVLGNTHQKGNQKNKAEQSKNRQEDNNKTMHTNCTTTAKYYDTHQNRLDSRLKKRAVDMMKRLL